MEHIHMAWNQLQAVGIHSFIPAGSVSNVMGVFRGFILEIKAVWI